MGAALLPLLALVCLLRVQQAGDGDGLGHWVRVAVGGGPTVLEVALLLLAHLAGDPDAGAPVGHAGGEVVDGGGLVEPREAPHVVLPAVRVVHSDVLGVFFAQLLDGLLDVSVIRWGGGREGGGRDSWGTKPFKKFWVTDTLVFSMKTHTLIYQMNFKMNIKYSRDIDEVRNNDFYCKY